MVLEEAVRLERAERRFRRDIWSVAPIDAVVEAGVQTRAFGPVFASVFAELPRADSLNLVQGAGEREAIVGRHLEDAIDWVSSWGVDYMIPVASDRPESERAELWLEWHDYEQGPVVRRYGRRASPPRRERRPSVEVQALPRQEDEQIAILAARGLGLPDLAEILFMGLPCLENWRCYLALLEGEPAATGSMMIGDGVATFGIDATLDFARGRGCHSALIERRLADAVAAGCQTIQAFGYDEPDTGPSAVTRNLLRAGFEETGRIVVWRPPRPTD